jgi:hypothetical protein
VTQGPKLFRASSELGFQLEPIPLGQGQHSLRPSNNLTTTLGLVSGLSLKVHEERGQLPTVIFYIALFIQQIYVEPSAVCQALCWVPGIHGKEDPALSSESSSLGSRHPILWCSRVIVLVHGVKNLLWATHHVKHVTNVTPWDVHVPWGGDIEQLLDIEAEPSRGYVTVHVHIASHWQARGMHRPYHCLCCISCCVQVSNLGSSLLEALMGSWKESHLHKHSGNRLLPIDKTGWIHCVTSILWTITKPVRKYLDPNIISQKDGHHTLLKKKATHLE